jgi:chromosome segregation ATPase
MSENEPHVSTDELRAALAPREWRRNPVLVSERGELAAPELQELQAALDDAAQLRGALDAARADAIELRAALDASRGDAAELRAELAKAREEARRRRAALERLASAGPFRRRRVIGQLRAQGLF